MTYFWNKNKEKFISLEKVRNFEVVIKGFEIKVIAWFSDVETVEVGKFEKKEQAEAFLENMETFTVPQEKK
jgi:hypothetical protein